MIAIFAGVRTVIAEHMSVPETEVTLDTNLAELGLQSVDLISVIYRLESVFSTQLVLRAEEVPDWETCTAAWVVDFVAASLETTAA